MPGPQIPFCTHGRPLGSLATRSNPAPRGQVKTAMKIPDERGCLALLRKHNTPEHIIRHCLAVWQAAKIIGEGLLSKKHPIDMNLLRAAGILHDIGKYPCIVDGYRYHDRKGQEMLDEEGLHEVGRIVARHVVLNDREGDPIREKHVVFYADKRVVDDKLVSLEERFDYLFRTYAKSPEAASRLQEMKDETIRLEEKIFKLLDFEPGDLKGLVQRAFSNN
jgi:putative nucleotidyltransferase with HDIG domain